MNRKITVMIGAALLILALGIWIGQSIEDSESRISHERNEAIVLPYQSGPYQFDLKISPAEPVVGENRLTLILRDQNGSPISGASISAVAEMPAMGAMQAMRAPAEWRESMHGLYEGSFDLTMKASWPLTLQIEAVGMPPRSMGFDMATGRRGLTPTFGVSGSAQTAMEEVPEGTIS
ncbi:MAG: FixH family protein, partial [Gammaproteobacteria bacterium]